jgi:hypothetical protein
MTVRNEDHYETFDYKRMDSDSGKKEAKEKFLAFLFDLCG